MPIGDGFGKFCGAGALAFALLISGCNSIPGASSPDVTNALAPGFANMQPGSEEDFMLNVGRRSYFAANSAELDETARMTLDLQIAWLRNHPKWLIKLQGFADDSANEADNVAISKRRADAVMAYLAAGGIDRNRMWAKGYGTERIVRDCPDLSCKALNRRVISNLRTEKDGAA